MALYAVDKAGNRVKVAGNTGGVSSFNGRSGAVMPKKGDYTAADVTVTPPEGMTATDVQGAVSELFTSVSEGKALIASAVTDKGVDTAADATFQTMRDNILAISSVPEGVRTITLTADPPEGGSVSGGGMASEGMTLTVSAEPNEADNYYFDGWKESGEVVQAEPVYTFPVTADKTLIAAFAQSQYTAGVDWWGTHFPNSSKWKSITYGNGKFVAVAHERGVSCYSEDGINWTMATLPSSANWNSVTYGNGKFVAVVYGGSNAAYSTDGITWKAATLPSTAKWSSVAYSDGKFVAVAFGGSNAAYSTDGITWKAATLPSSANWISVTYGNGKFVAVAFNGNAAYSANGIAWTAATMPQSAYWMSITYGNGKFLAVAKSYNYIAYSEDGITWVKATFKGANCASITYGDGKFVVAINGSSEAAYSEDGINWTMATLPSSANWISVTYGNGKFVAVAGDTSIDNKVAYSSAKGPGV